jgi:hypothetical protein
LFISAPCFPKHIIIRGKRATNRQSVRGTANQFRHVCAAQRLRSARAPINI